MRERWCASRHPQSDHESNTHCLGPMVTGEAAVTVRSMRATPTNVYGMAFGTRPRDPRWRPPDWT